MDVRLKLIKSPAVASRIHCFKDPGPVSAPVVTVRVTAISPSAKSLKLFNPVTVNFPYTPSVQRLVIVPPIEEMEDQGALELGRFKILKESHSSGRLPIPEKSSTMENVPGLGSVEVIVK